MSNVKKTKTPVPANPCIMVIFGMAGDLTKRLLYPAICNLGGAKLLDKNFTVIGVAVDDYDTASFKKELKKNVNKFVKEPKAKKYGLQLAESVNYIKGDFNNKETYEQLKTLIDKLSTGKASDNCLFYFASPPQFMQSIATGLNNAKLLVEKGKNHFRRLVVEKPFGHDLASAKKINKDLLGMVKESQIFRIDHFLGKETVQNLLALRFANGLFEPIWNHLYIDHVQITVSEELGVELRGGYYEHAGALRDMVPNHILQVLSLVGMEPPASFNSVHIQDEKDKVLQAVKIYSKKEVAANVIRGQYDAGEIDGEKVPAYRSEAKVSPQSQVETFVAMKLLVDNWRWYEVPFYIRTGKRMEARTSEVTIQFKSGPSALFGHAKEDIKPSVLCINIQPDEGISLRFNAKVPGTTMELEPVEMNFKYSDYFGVEPSTGYETILYECMNGDHLLFKRAETVELGWAIVDPILKAWKASSKTGFPNYDSGSWGPKAALQLIKKDGREWYP